jgi:hypothetical protein
MRNSSEFTEAPMSRMEEYVPKRRGVAPRHRRRLGRIWKVLLVLPGAWLFASPAHASFLSGETLDKAANVLAWVVLVVAPVIGIVVFWMVHILPEKIAEKKNHPQAKAIQTLCLLSLVFGGLLWPFAWLWAYTKPVFHKMAYGTDIGEPHEPGKPEPGPEAAMADTEVAKLKQKIAALEEQLALKVAREGRV